VAGRRRVLLLPPTLAYTGMYPYPVAHPYDRYAMPDLERPNAAAWPALAGARGSVALLRPGDLLFVPAFWCALAGARPILWHDVCLACVADARAPGAGTSAVAPSLHNCALGCSGMLCYISIRSRHAPRRAPRAGKACA